jgi:NAD(P)-dependent dehydrogenase (short-subunit alcohol dehydrogenase family)
VLVIDADLAQPVAAQPIVDQTLAAFGRIDALLNIAGAVPQIDLFEMTDEQWEGGLALKLHGARRLTIAAWPALKAAKGSVVLMSANSALFPRRPMRRWARSMPRSWRSPRRSRIAASPTACRSTASCRAR